MNEKWREDAKNKTKITNELELKELKKLKNFCRISSIKIDEMADEIGEIGIIDSDFSRSEEGLGLVDDFMILGRVLTDKVDLCRRMIRTIQKVDGTCLGNYTHEEWLDLQIKNLGIPMRSEDNQTKQDKELKHEEC